MITKNILITGAPGIGKTTLVRGVAAKLAELRPVGFTTEEIRRQGVRVGFVLSDLAGRQRVLSHREFGGPHRVGPYGVDVAGFEAFLEGIPFFDPLARVIVVDEIGKMECFSTAFRELVVRLLEGKKPFVASVAKKGGGLMADVKSSPGVMLFEVTRLSRASLPERITEEIRGIIARAPSPPDS
jgi:nucleoside-triphosphatase